VFYIEVASIIKRKSVRKAVAITLKKTGTAVEPSATLYSILRKGLLLETIKNLQNYATNEPYWREYVDVGKRIELLVPSQWANRPSRDTPVNLCAPDDPVTSIQLSFFALEKLLFTERASELIDFDANRWTLQRKEAVVHNGTGAYEADFYSKSGDATLMTRKLAVLALVTRLATWSRYGSVFRGVERSFSRYSGAQPRASAHLNAPRALPTPQVADRLLLL
jgi:hypothetical protein